MDVMTDQLNSHLTDLRVDRLKAGHLVLRPLTPVFSVSVSRLPADDGWTVWRQWLNLTKLGHGPPC